MRHIVHVVGRLSMGGAESRLLSVLDLAKADAARFTFLCFDPEPGPLQKRAEDLGAAIVHAPRSANPLQAIVQLRRVFKSLQCDVVHAHIHHYSGVCILAARMAGVPIRIMHVRTSRDDVPSTMSRCAYRWVMTRLIEQHATDIAGVSEAALDGFFGMRWRTDDRIFMLRNGFPEVAPPDDRQEILRECGLPADAEIAIHVGRFEPQKNHQMIVAIARELAAERPRLFWIFVGDGRLRPAVEQQIADAGLAGRTRLLGLRPDVVRLVNAADVFVFPSAFEGSPGAVLESLGVGTRVVASDIPEHREIAAICKDIDLVALQDVGGFARAVVRALDSPRAVSAAQTVRHHFSLERHLAGLNRLYRDDIFA